jgi:hypothetical protein
MWDLAALGELTPMLVIGTMVKIQNQLIFLAALGELTPTLVIDTMVNTYNLLIFKYIYKYPMLRIYKSGYLSISNLHIFGAYYAHYKA